MRTDRAAKIWIFIFFLCLYLLTAGGHYGGDGFWSYLTAESIVLDGDLAIGDREFLVKEMVNQYSSVPGEGVTEISGIRYSKYGLGMALAEVPFYAAGTVISRLFPAMPRDYATMFTTSMTNTVVCAVWCLVFFGFTGRFGYRRATRLWLTGIFGLGSMAFPYSGFGFSEPLVGLCLLSSIMALYDYRQCAAYRYLVIAGILGGLALATKIYVVIILPFLLFYIWPDLVSRPPKLQLRSWISLLAPLGIFVFLVAWHNWVRYGDILRTGYHLDDLASEFWTGKQGGYFTFSPINIGIALYGLLLSTGRGLIFFFPVAFLLPLAFWPFAKRHRREAALFVILIAAHIGFYACFRAWHGGSSWGPRYLLPIIPFLLLPLGVLLESPEARPAPVKLLGIIGGIVQLPAALVNYHLFVRFVCDNHIGDVIFFPRQPGDLLFSPTLSPIIGGYYQFASGAFRLFMNRSLTYPVPSASKGGLVSLASYDMIDIWAVNAIHTGFLGPLATIGILAIVLTLILSLAISAKRLIGWARAT